MTIWMNNDKSLIITKYNIIRQDDSNVAQILSFLFPTECDGIDLTDFSATLFYKVPNGDTFNVILNRDEELYKGYIRCTMPSAEDFTKYSGEVSMYVVLSKTVNEEPYTLTTSTLTIPIQSHPDYNPPTP